MTVSSTRPPRPTGSPLSPHRRTAPPAGAGRSDLERPPAEGLRPQPATAPLTTLGLVTVLSGTFLAMFDFFVVNVALPTIGLDLHASAATLELVVAGYAVAYAVLLVLGGRLGDSLGRRRLFLAGTAAFTLASLLCGLAPTAGVLVGARILQGAAAAFMVPQVLGTIQAATQGPARARALGLYGATGGLAAVAGQVGGGALVSADLAGTGWRPIFLLNVPIGVAGLLVARRQLPETRADRPVGVDLSGTLLLGATLLALLLPAVEGRQLGWPAWLLGLLALAPVVGAGFVAVQVRHERRGRVPLLPPSLVAVGSMRAGLAAAIPFFTGFGGFMFAYALAESTAGRAGPLATGLGIAPMGAAFLVASLVAVRLVTRYGARVLVAGALLQCAGLLLTAVTVTLSHPFPGPAGLAPTMTVLGLGQGLVMSPLFRFALSRVPVHRAGAAGGLLVTVQQVSLAAGVAVLGGLFLTLAPRVGVRTAFQELVLVQAALAVVVALAVRRLREQGPVPGAVPVPVLTPAD
jgi:MFS family permease